MTDTKLGRLLDVSVVARRRVTAGNASRCVRCVTRRSAASSGTCLTCVCTRASATCLITPAHSSTPSLSHSGVRVTSQCHQ